MKTNCLLTKLGRLFPKKYAKFYNDYVGLMSDKKPDYVNKILLCLDLDNSIFDIIKKEKPDLIITHHPFIYGTKKKVFAEYPEKLELRKKLDALNIGIYSIHTNFDAGDNGMNDALCEALGLEKIHKSSLDLCLRIGELNHSLNIYEFAKIAANKLNVDYSLLIDVGSKNIKTVGIIGGGAASYWRLAKQEGCDLYISGDVSHYIRRDIVNSNFNYLDMPHEIEKIFIPQMKKILLSIDDKLKIVCVDHEKLPKIIINN